jgi:hypothetical protein
MARFVRCAGWLSAGLLLAAACGGRSRPSTDQASGAAGDGAQAAAGERAEGATGGEPESATGDAEEAAAAIDGLRLELRSSKTIFDAGKPLDLTAWLINETDAPIVVLRRATHVDLGLDASNPNGEFITSLLPPEPPPPPTADDLAVIDPHGALELVDWEMLDRVNQQIAEGNGRTGRFRVAAQYDAGSGLSENLRQLDPTAWVGSLESNSILIDVQ